MSSLLEQYQLKEKDLNKQVTDLHIKEISRSHCKKWKSLPAYLEMEDIVASDIEKKPIEEEEKRNNFFSKWKEEKGSEATYKVLIGALQAMRCREDAESICKLLIAVPQPISSTTAGEFEQNINGWHSGSGGQGGERGRGRWERCKGASPP